MIAANINKIREIIEISAAKANRAPDEIKLVAVSKHFPASKIAEAYTAGQTIFGENYIQELQLKKEQAPQDAIFHFIGHLQSNKAKIAAATCDMIETIDSFKLGNALNSQLLMMNKTLDVLIQVNIGNDEKKAGVSSSEVETLLIQLSNLPKIKICGLMTMPPYSENPEHSRPHFRALKQLSEKLQRKGLFFSDKEPELSMGMSNDFPIAIEEGATIVRVGTAIFGNR